MRIFLFKMTKWFIIASFVLGAIPETVFSKDLLQRTVEQQPSIKVEYDFSMPADEKEKALKGDKVALAALKHTTAKEMKRKYFNTGDIKKLYTALNVSGDAIKLNPNVAGYWVTLGTIHSELARLNIFRSNEYAQDSYRQAIELAPYDAATMVLLAVNLARAGEYEEALEHFEKAVDTNILLLSVDIAKWMNVCYLADAQTRRGIVFYDSVQKNHPEFYYLNLYKAILYQAHFDYNSAARELNDLLKRDDTDHATKQAAQKLLGEIDKAKGKRS